MKIVLNKQVHFAILLLTKILKKDLSKIRNF